MSVRRFIVSWASCAYFHCILTLLLYDGMAAHHNDGRGQPEMQQAMDNAPSLPPNNLPPFPSRQDSDFPILLTQKTSTLLSEALHMLPKIKDVKERRWMEAFIHRLGSLSSDLERSSPRMIFKAHDAAPQTLEFKEPSVPSSRPSETASKSKLQTKYQVTSAQVNDVIPVNEASIHRQLVTRPSLLPALMKSDYDLVAQLHDQVSNRMKPRFHPIGAQAVYQEGLLDSTVTTQAGTPPTSPINSRDYTKLKVMQTQKEVRKHQQEPNIDTRNLFKLINSQHVADFTNPDFVHNQKHNVFQQDDEFEIEEDGGAATGELAENDESQKDTVSPSWQQMMEAARVEARHHVPKPPLHPPINRIDPAESVNRIDPTESINLIDPAEPTMSDEMERELRAGKIVVLSHSLVKTNFKPKDHNNRHQKTDSVTQPV